MYPPPHMTCMYPPPHMQYYYFRAVLRVCRELSKCPNPLVGSLLGERCAGERCAVEAMRLYYKYILFLLYFTYYAIAHHKQLSLCKSFCLVRTLSLKPPHHRVTNPSLSQEKYDHSVEQANKYRIIFY